METLKKIINTEYADISTDSIIHRGKLRVFVKDGSIIDVWFSLKISGRFSYHWERRHIDGTMYRHDNRGFSVGLRLSKRFIQGTSDQSNLTLDLLCQPVALCYGEFRDKLFI